MRATLSDEKTERALAVVRAWVDAFNRRDVDALVRLAHPAVAVYPTKLFRHRDRYAGHDGVRRWIADVDATDAGESVSIADVRPERSGDILITGEIVVHDRPVGPVAGLFTVQDGLVTCARSYLSDEQTMRDVGHIDP